MIHHHSAFIDSTGFFVAALKLRAITKQIITMVAYSMQSCRVIADGACSCAIAATGSKLTIRWASQISRICSVSTDAIIKMYRDGVC